MKYATKSTLDSDFTAVLINLVSGLFLAGAANASEYKMPVRTIDEVADGTMPMVQGISATEAVIKFQSTIPLAH